MKKILVIDGPSVVIVGIIFLLIAFFAYVQLNIAPEEKERRLKERANEQREELLVDLAKKEKQLEGSCKSELDAFVWSQHFVKQQLESPSTAVFPDSLDEGIRIEYLGNCTHKIYGYVDSQNSFGAVTRTKYQAFMQNKKGSDEWKATKIIFLND